MPFLHDNARFETASEIGDREQRCKVISQVNTATGVSALARFASTFALHIDGIDKVIMYANALHTSAMLDSVVKNKRSMTSSRVNGVGDGRRPRC